MRAASLTYGVRLLGDACGVRLFGSRELRKALGGFSGSQSLSLYIGARRVGHPTPADSEESLSLVLVAWLPGFALSTATRAPAPPLRGVQGAGNRRPATRAGRLAPPGTPPAPQFRRPVLLAAASRLLPRSQWRSFMVTPTTPLRWHWRLVAHRWIYAAGADDPQSAKRFANSSSGSRERTRDGATSGSRARSMGSA